VGSPREIGQAGKPTSSIGGSLFEAQAMHACSEVQGQSSAGGARRRPRRNPMAACGCLQFGNCIATILLGFQRAAPFGRRGIPHDAMGQRSRIGAPGKCGAFGYARPSPPDKEERAESSGKVCRRLTEEKVRNKGASGEGGRKAGKRRLWAGVARLFRTVAGRMHVPIFRGARTEQKSMRAKPDGDDAEKGEAGAGQDRTKKKRLRFLP